MSTIPEVLAANVMGMKVCACSLITNLASGLSMEILNHDEVCEAAIKYGPQLCKLLSKVCSNLGDIIKNTDPPNVSKDNFQD